MLNFIGYKLMNVLKYAFFLMRNDVFNFPNEHDSRHDSASSEMHVI